jgi:phosphotransferase system  glucose/maltose/N-acetylglucosamine-specific IIC component
MITTQIEPNMLYNLLEIFIFPILGFAMYYIIKYNNISNPEANNSFKNKTFSKYQTLSVKNRACLIPHYIY